MKAQDTTNPYQGGGIGAARLSLFKHNQALQFFTDKTREHKQQTTLQELRERKCFSQPEVGLQGYVLYLIH